MAQGISLHVGVNQPDPQAFDPDFDPLVGCVNDADEMRKIAEGLGYTSTRLVDGQATFKSVTDAILAAAHTLKSGDVFLFTFAGHGTEVNDFDLEPFEFQDEAAILRDFMLLDDVLGRGLWPAFAEGVRIVMVADSCHSGTLFEVPAPTPMDVRAGDRPRVLSENARHSHIEANRGFYKQLVAGLPPPPVPIKASVVLLAACHDGDRTGDGSPNGKFTGALLDVWKEGTSACNYEDFRTAIENHPNMKSKLQQPLLKQPQHSTPFDLAQPVFRI